MHISDFLSRHPDDENSPNEIIPIAFMLRKMGEPDFPDIFLYLKEEVDALPEQENYKPYHEDDFMFIFSNDSHETCHFYHTYILLSIQELKHSMYALRKRNNRMIY